MDHRMAWRYRCHFASGWGIHDARKWTAFEKKVGVDRQRDKC